MRKSPELSRDEHLILDTHNKVPLYFQICEYFRQKIRDGEYNQGDYLPGEREISESFRVSRITAVRALNELAKSGVVARERGRGTRVQLVATGVIKRGPMAINATERQGAGKRSGFEEGVDVLRGAYASEFVVLEMEYIPASEEIANALRLAPGTEVQHAVRVSHFQGKPYHHLSSFVPATLGRNWTREDLEVTPLNVLLNRAGARLGRIDETVTATTADGIIAQRLEMAVGSPLLKIYRTAIEVGGWPVEYLIGHYSPERYQYAVSITPQGGLPGVMNI